MPKLHPFRDAAKAGGLDNDLDDEDLDDDEADEDEGEDKIFDGEEVYDENEGKA